MDGALQSTSDSAHSEASSAPPSTTSCASTPPTTVDTPFETQDDVAHNNENGHEHDGASTSRKPEPNYGVVETHAQLQKLQAKLIELETRAERETALRQQLEVKLQDEIIPAAESGFARSTIDVAYLANALRTRDGDGEYSKWEHYRRTYGLQTEKDNSIGQVTRLSIELLEKELSNLKSDLEKMTEVEQDRERLQKAEALWMEERTSLLEKQRKLGLVVDEAQPASAVSMTEEPGADQLPTTDPAVNAATSSAQHFKIPDINLVPWLDFKLCLIKAPAKSFAIDVLDGEPDISFERPRFYNRWSHAKKAETVRPRTNLTKMSEKVQVRGQKPISERIRINSKHILKILSQIHGETLTLDNESPLVMTRPYKALDYWSEAIRAKFLQLESRFGSSGDHFVGAGSLEVSSAAPEAEKQGSKSSPVPRESTSESSGNKSDAEEKEEEDEWTNSVTAYRHLKCLVRFMDEQLLGKTIFLESERCKTVAFTDIWYLFKPGDEVVDQSLKQVYRVIGVISPGHQVFPPWRAKWDKDIKAREETPVYLHCVYIDFDGKQLGPLLRTVKIPRYDNEKAVTSLEVFPIRFAEDKISPLSSDTNKKSRKTLREQFIERGKLFMNMTGFKHMQYNGMTLDTRDEVDSNVVVDFQEAFSYFQQAQKNAFKDYPREYVEHNSRRPGEYSSGRLDDYDPGRHVESRWEAQMENKTARADWMPKLCTIIGMPLGPSFEEDDCTAECCTSTDEIHIKDGFAEKKRNGDYIHSLMPEGRDDPPPSIYPRRLEDIKSQENSLVNGDYLIMSYRVFGFVLRSRKWAQLDINHLTLPDTSPTNKALTGRINKDIEKKGNTEAEQSAIKAEGIADNIKAKDEDGNGQEVEDDDDSAFGQLVLPPGHKKMVKSLVAQHFRDKESQEERKADIISGKGKGLIILLHGAPGVGKTTTAEGVAQMFEKPLYQITCGDLGTTASEVEKALETSFNLASRWSCVLLLDEADVFLAERSRLEFTRNGLVSVFLRVLEYYTGVLFLTTNRIGDFDEAFASRIHISLYYPQLDEASTLSIFNLNLDMIDGNHRKGEIKIDRDEIIKFATDYFWSQKEARWNGRQIRNACHTALALAEFRAQGGSHKKVKDPGAIIHLKVDDLEIVSNAYLEFMKYLTEVHDKKGFEMWAKSVNIRAREEDFSQRMEKMYEEMKRRKATKEQQNQPDTRGLSQAPGYGASQSATTSPAHAAAPLGSRLTKKLDVSHEQASASTHRATSPGPKSFDAAVSSAEQPHPQPQPPAYGPGQGYPPPGAWPGYYPHPGYAQPPPGNPAGPPPMAPQPYLPWHGDQRGYPQYPMPGGHAGPYPPQPPPGSGVGPS